jgi:hypothetical protein
MDKMEKLVNYDSASGENSPNNFAPQPLSKAAVPDVPIVSISIKGAGARSTSGQYTPELPSSGTTEKKTPVKIQLPNKAHSLTRRPPTPSVPFSKGLESRDKMTVRGASNTATKDFVKPIVPEVEDGEEGEVVEGEIETAKEGLTETGSVVVARQTFGENLQRKLTCFVNAMQSHLRLTCHLHAQSLPFLLQHGLKHSLSSQPRTRPPRRLVKAEGVTGMRLRHRHLDARLHGHRLQQAEPGITSNGTRPWNRPRAER